MSCPHADRRFCPLYHAAHDAAIVDLSCDDGRLEEQSCAVDRGRLAYARQVELLRVRCPRLVAELSFQEEAAFARAQRRRNMHAAGLH